MEWYESLAKPDWTPAPSTIGLIWTLLYPVILGSFAFVFVQIYRGALPRWMAWPFLINLATNLLFMPIFSGLRSVHLAALDILIVWATIVWLMVAIWPRYKWVALAQLPYFAWVSIATFLQISITWMNWEA